MASIEKRISKKGEVSYRIKVSLGYDSNGKQIIERSDTIKFDSGMTSRKIDKELKSGDHRSAAPGFDNRFLAALLHSIHFLFKFNADERAFF